MFSENGNCVQKRFNVNNSFVLLQFSADLDKIIKYSRELSVSEKKVTKSELVTIAFTPEVKKALAHRAYINRRSVPAEIRRLVDSALRPKPAAIEILAGK
jgi:hypothetical protein